MSPLLAERLVSRLRGTDATDTTDVADVERLRGALERYRPRNLSELYMALRAVSAGSRPRVLELVRRQADEHPELGLEEFVGRSD